MKEEGKLKLSWTKTSKSWSRVRNQQTSPAAQFVQAQKLNGGLTGAHSSSLIQCESCL